MPRFHVIWLDQRSKARNRATRDDAASARELWRELIAAGHGDVRYRREGESRWRSFKIRKPKARKKGDVQFPPTAKSATEKHKRAKKKRSDALDKRYPGSIGTGKRR